MSQDIIHFYSHNEQPYECFSNYFVRQIIYKDDVFPTSEHAFQAYKFVGTERFNEIKNSPTAKNAKELGNSRKIKIRADWEKVKDEIMEEIVLAKFTQHEDLKAILLYMIN